MKDDVLAAALKAAVPWIDLEDAQPGRDLWPVIAAGPARTGFAWSWVDVGLAAAGAGTLFLRPDLILVLLWYL